MALDIRVSAELWNHPKVRKLQKELNMHRAKVIGHLVLLWSGVAKLQPNGILKNFDANDLAEIAHVSQKKSKEFKNALIHVGMLEEDLDSKTITVHNWEIHQPYVSKSTEISAINSRNSKLRWAKERGAPKSCDSHYGSHCESHCKLHTESQCPFPYRTLPYHSIPHHPAPTEDASGRCSENDGIIFVLYSENIGPIKPGIINDLKIYEELCTDVWIREVFVRMIAAGDSVKSPWAYIKKILDTWISKGEMDTVNKTPSGNGNHQKDDISAEEYLSKYGGRQRIISTTESECKSEET